MELVHKCVLSVLCILTTYFTSLVKSLTLMLDINVRYNKRPNTNDKKRFKNKRIALLTITSSAGITTGSNSPVSSSPMTSQLWIRALKTHFYMLVSLHLNLQLFIKYNSPHDQV